jgi:hypothetical protein
VRSLRVAFPLALAVVALVTPPSAAATQPEPPAQRLHYVFVRVDTGQPGVLATDRDLTGYAAVVTRFWASIPGAPRIAVTVDHRLLHGTPKAPSCGMTVGRDALAAAGTPAADTDGVVTFLRQGYPCPHYTAHAAQPGLDVEAFGGGVWLTWDRVAHEIGHNLGLCAGATHDRQAPSRWTPADFTGPTSYGNPFSVMGGGEGPPSAPCQAAAGWLTPRPLPPRATVRVNALEHAGANRAALFTAAGHTWTLEYRAKAQPDAATLGPTHGVALYRDGAIVETAADTYVLPVGRAYRAAAGLVLTVVTVRPDHVWVRRN